MGDATMADVDVETPHGVCERGVSDVEAMVDTAAAE